MTETQEITRVVSYFAEDGNYGSADGLCVMETTNWSELDWEIIESVSDEQRPFVARLLTESYEAGANNDFIKQKLLDSGVAPELLETE